MSATRVYRRSVVALGLLGSTVLASGGCVGLLSNLLHAVQGEFVPAEFGKLAGKRVAVVAISESSAWSDDQAAKQVARHVGEAIEVEVLDTDVVPEAEVDQWRDVNGWDSVDLAAIGKGVKADYVILIEIGDLVVRDGQTLYRGRAEVTTSVYDVAEDKTVFRRHLPEFLYPVNAGVYATETTEPRFRRAFLLRLGQRIARYFHPYDFIENYAQDEAVVNT
jgi:hypothetical protein